MPFLRIPLLIPILLLSAGMAFGTFSAYDPALSLPLAAALWLGGGLCLLIAVFARTPRTQQFVAAGIVGFAAGYTAVCFGQYRYLGFERKIELIARIGDLTSAPFPVLLDFPFQQNMAAATLACALPIAFGLAAHSAGRLRWLWGAAALLIGAGVVLTVSRGAWAALAIAALVAAAARIASYRPRLLLGLSIAALLAGISGGVVLLSLWGIDGIAERAGSRLSLYRTALPLAIDTFYSGIGPGATFAQIYSRYGLLIQVPYLTYSHNLLLAVWLGGGISALLGMVWMIGELGLRFWRARQAGSGPIWLGAAAGSLALFLHGLVDAPQYNAGWYAMLIAWATVGLALAAGRADQPARRQRLGRPAFIGATLAVAVAALLFWQPLAALAAVNAGATTQARADFGPDLSDAERTALRQAAEHHYRTAVVRAPELEAAQRRLGLYLLAVGRYAEALGPLAQARRSDPGNQTSAKALGYAYLWTGQIAAAADIFAGLERRGEIRAELGVYAWWWEAEGGRPDLAEAAAAAATELDRR
ncbi:MAG: hypothetical protein HC822_07415 [Oscillochloris sp.]|nr:hypothetical protein [Oscillochloris sp.]